MILSRLTNENGDEFTVDSDFVTNDNRRFNTLSEANAYILSKRFSYTAIAGQQVIHRLAKRNPDEFTRSSFGKAATDTLYTIQHALKSKLTPQCRLTLTSKQGDAITIIITYVSIRPHRIFMTYQQDNQIC